jgi:hypothetical protein
MSAKIIRLLFLTVLASEHVHGNLIGDINKHLHFALSVPITSARRTSFTKYCNAFLEILHCNSDHNNIPFNLTSLKICFAETKVLLQLNEHICQRVINPFSIFANVTQTIQEVFFFNLTWDHSALFVVVLPRCMTWLGHTLTNFSLIGPSTVFSTYWTNLGHCPHLSLNVFSEELYSSSDADSTIFSQVVLTFLHTSLNSYLFLQFCLL